MDQTQIFLCHGCKHSLLNVIQPVGMDRQGNAVIMTEVVAPWCNAPQNRGTIAIQLRIKACEAFEVHELTAAQRIEILSAQEKAHAATSRKGLGAGVALGA